VVKPQSKVRFDQARGTLLRSNFKNANKTSNGEGKHVCAGRKTNKTLARRIVGQD